MTTRTAQMTYAPHGEKRPHEDDVDNTQRLTKRFHLLDLENQENGNLWTSSGSNAPPPTPTSNSRGVHSDLDFMPIDDTPHRVYIHDLDAELANVSDAETNEERIVFLPDIERRLAKLPKHLLSQEKGKKDGEEAKSQEMVLYSVPRSISIPEEEDSVRKAILESRKGWTCETTGDGRTGREVSPIDTSTKIQGVSNGSYLEPDDDPDAMDIS